MYLHVSPSQLSPICSFPVRFQRRLALFLSSWLDYLRDANVQKSRHRQRNIDSGWNFVFGMSATDRSVVLRRKVEG